MALRKSNPPAETPQELPKTSVGDDVPLATDIPTRVSRPVRTHTPSPAAAAQPAQESPEPEQLDQAEPAASEAPPQNAVATRPAARQGAVSVGGQGLGLASPFDSLENNIPPGELAFGSIPRYTASNGLIQDSDKFKIGSWVQFEPVSFNYSYMMAPGSQDEDAKEFLKFSYDGEMCNDGTMSMKEALEAAVAAGFKTAAIKRYIELFGILLGAEKLPDESPALNKLVMMSLSPESVKLWNGFKVQTAVQCKIGRMKPEDLRVVTAVVNVKTYGNNTFSCFNFEV